MIRKQLFYLLLFAATVHLRAQDFSEKHVQKFMEGKEQRLQSLNDAKFGMFIHWGPYAVIAGAWEGQRIGGLGEWIMYNGKIPVKKYEEMARTFNPVKFNADEWANLAREAGMRYMVITAKHCDGFAMFDSEVSDYNIVDWTPFKRDVSMELANACKKQGIELGFYYSHWWDWHESNALGLSNTWDFPDSQGKKPDIYIHEKSVPQVTELVKNYNPYIIWFDVPSGPDGDISTEQSYQFLKTIRTVDPGIIINNRIGNEMGDYGTPEQYIPSGSSTFEVCMTLNDTWGYKYYDHAWKSPETVIRNLADIAHKGGNYLLNVGPTAEGIIPPASVRILQEVGKWMVKNGESIYGTTASPIGNLPFNGRCTAKPGKLFIHVFDWPDNRQLVVPGIGSAIEKIYLLADPKRDPLIFHQKSGDVLIELAAVRIPSSVLNEHNTVIAIEYTGALEVDKRPLLVDPAQRTYLTPDVAVLSGGKLEYAFHNVWDDPLERGYHLDNWNDTDATASWNIRTMRSGAYEVYLKYGAPSGCEVNSFEISVGDNVIKQHVENTGGWFTYQSFPVGDVIFDEADSLTLTIQPTKLGGCALMNLKEVCLVPIMK